jgi:hypothetical protein
MTRKNRPPKEVRQLLATLPDGWSEPRFDGQRHWRIDGPNGEVVQWPGNKDGAGQRFWLEKKLRRAGVAVR